MSAELQNGDERTQIGTRISVESMKSGALSTISGPSGVSAEVGGQANVKMLGEVSRNLESDTFTMPTDAQLMAGLQASRGDAVYSQDDTTLALEQRIARLTGKEDALFVVSGTAGNQIAVRTHLTQPPHSVLLDSRAHIHKWESGGIALFSQAMSYGINPANGRYLTLEDDILPNLELGENIQRAPTRLIALENTLSGIVFPQEEIEKIAAVAKEHDIFMHLDGARIWEVAAKACEQEEKGGEEGLRKVITNLCQPFNSVSLCMNKGLGAPFGSVLVGSKTFIKKARWFQKMFGGGIRQCGALAAAADWALTNTFPRLAYTHKLAQKLSNGILALGGRLLLPTETNIVSLDLSSLNIRGPELIKRGREMFPENPLTVGSTRFVVHHQIEERAIDDVLALLRSFKDDM